MSYFIPLVEGNCPFLPRYSEDIFSSAERGGEEDYGIDKITKIKRTKILVTNFDKFHHLCNLYIFDLCFVVQ